MNRRVTFGAADETVLDLFIIPDGRSGINGIPILLDENLQPVDESGQPYAEGLQEYLGFE